MHFMCFLKAHPERSKAFRTWFYKTHVPQLREHAPASLRRLVVNLADDPPDGFVVYGNQEANVGPAYDVLLQVWCDSRDDFDKLMEIDKEARQAWVELTHSYHISETEVLQRPDLLSGTPTPGYKLIRGLFFYDDMPDTLVQRSWEHHQHLAVKVHIGLARYVRHWVEEILSPDAPAIRGLSELHFPSEEALLDRYFDSSRGEEEILHDIGHFISGGTRRLFCREYVIN